MREFKVNRQSTYTDDMMSPRKICNLADRDGTFRASSIALGSGHGETDQGGLIIVRLGIETRSCKLAISSSRASIGG